MLKIRINAQNEYEVQVLGEFVGILTKSIHLMT